MELILARILPKLKTVTNFKVVLLSATLNVAEFLQRAKDAGLEDRYIQTMDSEARHQELVNMCLPPSTPMVRDNLELAVRTLPFIIGIQRVIQPMTIRWRERSWVSFQESLKLLKL